MGVAMRYWLIAVSFKRIRVELVTGALCARVVAAAHATASYRCNLRYCRLGKVLRSLLSEFEIDLDL
jgi:hypothetical protein